MTVHLTVAGAWVECHATQRRCPRAYHLPGDAAEARRVPLDVLDRLLGYPTGQPVEDSEGNRVWRNSADQTHRDYDLPAFVRADGSHSEWWRNGQRHRGGGRPAVVKTNGYQAWWVNGVLHRAGGKPAIISPRGREYWEHGVQITPAVEPI